jgi:hypothetical protein
MTLDRRRFLQLSALSVVATLAESGCQPNRTILQPELLGMLGPDRVREIGNHYRSATPAESTREALRTAIFNSQSVLSALPFNKHYPIDDMIRDNYADGRIVLVDGWVLSLTEARQCALYSLT